MATRQRAIPIERNEGFRAHAAPGAISAELEKALADMKRAQRRVAYLSELLNLRQQQKADGTGYYGPARQCCDMHRRHAEEHDAKGCGKGPDTCVYCHDNATATGGEVQA